MVIALQEKIAAFDACTFKSCFCITSEYFFNFKNIYIKKSDEFFSLILILTTLSWLWISLSAELKNKIIY